MSGGPKSIRFVALAILLCCCAVDANTEELPIPPLAEVVHRDAEAILGVYPGMLHAAQRSFAKRFHRAGYRGESFDTGDKTRLVLWTRQNRDDQIEGVFMSLSQHKIGQTTFRVGPDRGESEPDLTDPAKPTDSTRPTLTKLSPKSAEPVLRNPITINLDALKSDTP